MYNLKQHSFYSFQNWPRSLACMRQNQCRMQRKIVEEKEEGRWLLNSSSPCWDAQAERGAAHWAVRALFPGRRPVPALALYHRKLSLLLELGKSRNIWWNSPTGHLSDKWIELCSQLLAYAWVEDGADVSFIFWRSYRCRRLFWLSFIHLSFGLRQKLNGKQFVKLQRKHISKATIDWQHRVPVFLRNSIKESKKKKPFYFFKSVLFFQELD